MLFPLLLGTRVKVGVGGGCRGSEIVTSEGGVGDPVVRGLFVTSIRIENRKKLLVLYEFVYKL